MIKPYKALHKIPLLPYSRLYGPSQIYCVPDLCHRCWSQSYLVRLLRRQFSSEKSGYQAPPRKQKARGECSFSAGSQEWRVGLQKLLTNTSLLGDNYRRAGLRFLPVADNEWWFLHQTAPLKWCYSSGCYLFIYGFHFLSVFMRVTQFSCPDFCFLKTP